MSADYFCGHAACLADLDFAYTCGALSPLDPWKDALASACSLVCSLLLTDRDRLRAEFHTAAGNCAHNSAAALSVNVLSIFAALFVLFVLTVLV